jgi:hypothetical protein
VPDSPSSDRGSDQPQVWSRVPQRNENFTGREEILEALRVSLTSDASASAPHRGSGEAVGVVLTALQGMGGVGKTQLAVEYAWRFAGEYDLIGWIAADQPILVRSSLAPLAPRRQPRPPGSRTRPRRCCRRSSAASRMSGGC